MIGAMRRALSIVMLLGVVATGCSHSQRPSKEDAEQTVRDFFAGLERHDCDLLMRTIGGDLGREVHEQGCEKVLGDVGGMRMVSIDANQPDGRDPNARLIHVMVAGKTKMAIIRVELENNRWVITKL